MQENNDILRRKIKSLKLEILRDTNEKEMDFHIHELLELEKTLNQSKDKS